VFSSITAEQIDIDSTAPRGVQALKSYLQFAASGGTTGPVASERESGGGYERHVQRAREARGGEIRRGVGCEGFTIDLAGVDPGDPDRYLAGIECDGPTYRACATARDRDRLREAVLEGLAHGTIVAASVRDVLVRKEPGKERAMAALAQRLYGMVLVHADPAFVRLEDSFGAAAEIADLVRYTGFLRESGVGAAGGGTDGEGEIIVSAGGGAVGGPLQNPGGAAVVQQCMQAHFPVSIRLQKASRQALGRC